MAATTFQYKVRDSSGKLVEGSLEGDNEALVAERLRQMGFVPVSIQAQGKTSMKRELNIPGITDRVPLKALAVFSRQFSTLINSGLSLLRALTVLVGQTENTALRKVITDVRAQVERGISLSAALGSHPKVFNRLFISMVRAGEASGGLDRALLSLAETIEKQVALRGKIKSAMAYPVTVLGLVCLILAAMLLFIIPQFKNIYKTLNGKLPAPTRLLMAVSNLMVHSLPLVLVALVLGVVLLRRAIRTPSGRATWDTLKLRVPIFGGLLRKTALSRFSNTLSALLSSGVPVLESLEITKDTVNNVVVGRGVEAIGEGVRRGESITRALEDHPVFPNMVKQMMNVGEETGGLDAMLAKAGAFLDGEIERTVEALTSLLEPLMIVVLGSAVGSMVVALYLPMFNVVKLVGNSGGG